jgi:signal transduction histidine kinase
MNDFRPDVDEPDAEPANRDALFGVISSLFTPAADWNGFWGNVSAALGKITKWADAFGAMILIPRRDSVSHVDGLMPQAAAGIPIEDLTDKVFSYDDVLLRDIPMRAGTTALVPLDHNADPATVSGTIASIFPEVFTNQTKVMISCVNLEEERLGILLLFHRQDQIETTATADRETAVFQSLMMISTAYNNCAYYQRRQQATKQWLKRVTHQIIAPIHGIQGYAEYAQGLLSQWQREGADSTELTGKQFQRWKEAIARWEATFDSIVFASRYAARLTHNLSWVIYDQPANVDLEPVYDVGRFLVGVARDFQGLARARRLRSVYVDTDSVVPINNRICVDINLFRQAIGNLLDNAIKYSKPDANILVQGKLEDTARIEITNIGGIQLRADEVDQIFTEGYRTQEAARAHTTGTGIGLAVAHDIITRLGGSLTAQPSTKTSTGWQTTFVVSLPLRNAGCDQENSYD